MSAAVAKVAELVRRETGMTVKDARLPALEAAIGRVAPGLSPERLLAELEGRAPGALLHRLVDEVTVQETYFFRELRDLEQIDWQGLLAAARERGFGMVRVWVAGCATGEEAYTLAILACETFGTATPPVTILGTDISNAAIAQAAAGRGYSERSVRNLTAPLRRRYLGPEDDNRHRVKEPLRSTVRFRHHNLVADPSPPPGEVPFDLVCCRNVLIYFDPPTVERALAALAAGVRPGGRLLLGAADRLTGTASGLGGDLTAPPERPRASWRPPRRPLGLRVPPAATRVDGPGAGGGESSSQERIAQALLAADADDLDLALEIVETVLSENPLAADAHFVRALVELGRTEPGAAVVSLRRCLYLDPSFGLAAFELGRAYDAAGNSAAARRSYERALRSLDPEDERHRAILDQIDLGDVAHACAVRLSRERAA